MLCSPLNHTPTITSTPPLWLPDGGVSETRKASVIEGASVQVSPIGDDQIRP